MIPPYVCIYFDLLCANNLIFTVVIVQFVHTVKIFLILCQVMKTSQATTNV